MQYISIIPQGLNISDQSHRYFRLPHPRTGLPQLYLHYSQNGRDVLLEANKVQCSHRRIWFIGDSQIEAGSILIHHTIDPLFLVIPIIAALINQSVDQDSIPFQPLSDLITTASALSAFSLPEAFTAPGDKGSSAGSGVNEDIARLLAIKSVRKVFRLCCERKAIPLAPPSPPESSSSTSAAPRPSKQVYYRPSMARAVTLLQTKVDYFSSPERFEQFDHLVRGLSRDGLYASESTGDLVEGKFTDRRKMTCDHLAQWLAPPVLSALIGSYDFAPLSEYLANRTAATLAAQAPIVNAKKEDKGTKRKAVAGSRGVEALKKVNTASMSKLTSFFKPKEGKK